MISREVDPQIAKGRKNGRRIARGMTVFHSYRSRSKVWLWAIRGLNIWRRYMNSFQEGSKMWNVCVCMCLTVIDQETLLCEDFVSEWQGSNRFSWNEWKKFLSLSREIFLPEQTLIPLEKPKASLLVVRTQTILSLKKKVKGMKGR